MKNIALLFFVLITTLLSAQSPNEGTKAWAEQQQLRNSNPTVQDGNGVLGFLYDSTACGLNYTQASVKLGQRFPNPGVLQPASFPITGIPFCAQIDKAWLWCAGSGNGVSITATVTNPVGTTANFPMTMIGQDQDMCWGYAGSFAYRVDVTSIISGNGNYMISGLPTLPTPGNDMDGATLFIIYKDPTATYTGSIHIDDGCVTINGGTATHLMTGFNSCANSTSADGFMLIANLQMLGTYLSVDGGPNTQIAEDWWNFASLPASIGLSQATCDFNVSSGGDCFSIAMAGLYTQTNCFLCTPTTGGLTITNPSTTTATCIGNGAATIAVSGGSGNYTISWNTNPLQTGLTATNLSAGVYTVTVSDSTAGMCGALSVTIPYAGPVLTTSTTGVNCSTLGSATVNVSGGTSPYTYSWSPLGGNAATATNLPAGIYTVSVTDSTGCIISSTDTVQNNSNLSVITLTTPDSCPSPAGFMQAIVSGGQPPYTYSWMPGGQTTSSVSNQLAGTYTVDVTDSAGCVISSVVTVGPATNQTTVAITGTNFFNCGDSIQLLANSPYSPATFVWSPSTYLNNPNIQNPVATPYAQITYTVTATSQCGTGTDTFTLSPSPASNTNNELICLVTVDTAISKNVVIWERNNSPVGGSYTIYRETNSTGVYAAIGSQPISAFTTYTDLIADPNLYASRYRITTVDSCGIESDLFMLHHRTIFLQLSNAIPAGYNLSWSMYEGATISNYEIYRGSNPGMLSLIGTVSANTFTYTDAAPPVGPQFYVVLALPNTGACVPSLRLLDAAAMRNTNPAVQSTLGSLSNIVLTTEVSVNENNILENSMNIIPNPGNGNFQLSMSLAHAQKIEVLVYDNLGRKVYSQNENASGGNYSATMNLSSLSSGIYSVQVITANGFAVKRLVIE